jgi:hypothetical protein
MSAEPKVVPLGLDVARSLYLDLEEYVVSLDRILSRIGAGASPDILLGYVVDRRLFQRIAEARGAVGDALEAVVGESQMESMAEGAYRYSD